MKKVGGKMGTLLSIALLSACQSGQPSSPLSLETNKSPSSVIVSVGKAMQKCWFKTGDPAFKLYRLANEVNSYAGRPRLLLVPKNNPAGLPTLVVQAEQRGNSTNLQTYGPILSSRNGKRIADDIQRWSRGSSSCKALG